MVSNRGKAPIHKARRAFDDENLTDAQIRQIRSEALHSEVARLDFYAEWREGRAARIRASFAGHQHGLLHCWQMIKADVSEAREARGQIDALLGRSYSEAA